MKRFFTILVFTILLGGSAFAYDFSAVCESGQTLYYNITSNTEPYTVSVTSRFSDYPYYSTYPTGDLTIPETVEYNNITCSVTSIGNFAFFDCRGLTSLSIPNSVTSIGGSAFSDCSGLTEISIPNSVTSIGEGAFLHCSGLTSLSIPNSVTSIGNGAFYYCSGLTSLSIPNSVTSIGVDVFSGCSRLESIVIDSGNSTYDSRNDCNAIIETESNTLIQGCMNTEIPNSVTSIGDYAFNCSGLTSLSIPNSVTSIGNYAFQYCSGLISVTIGNSVTSIGDYAFYYCSGLTGALTIPNSVTSIGDGAFSGCSGLTTVNFNATNCTGMGNPNFSVFEYCTSLSTLNIGDNVTNIPDYAFSYCSGLISVTIGNSVTSIGNSAFYVCTELTSLTIPNSVTSIGNYAFAGCRLTSVTSRAIVPPQVEYYAFGEVSTDIPVYVPCATKQAYQNAYGWGDFTNIQIIEGETFQYTASVSVAEGSEDFGSVEILHQPDCEDASFSIEATPIEHYHFVSWSDGSVNNPYNLIVVRDTALLANFHIDTYSLLLSVNNSAMGTVSGEGIYGYDSSVEISANPNYGYHFVSWNDGNTDNPRTITVLQDSIFTANFDNNEYTINVQSDSLVMGSVVGAGTFRYLDAIQIEAMPEYGYHFTNWNDGNTDNPRTITVSRDSLFVASFDNNNYEIYLQSADSVMGNVIGAGTFRYLDEIQIEAIPEYGYHFVSWDDGNTANPRTITVLQDISYTANFDNNEYTINVLSDSLEMGTVSGGNTYRYLDSISIEANANEGYIFVRWNDGNTENPRNIVVERDSTFTATFGILNEISITDCNNYDLGGGYNFYETGTHYGFFTNAEGVDSVVRLDLTIEQPLETTLRVVATNNENRNVVTWNSVSNNTMLGYLVYRQNAYGEFEVVDSVAIDAECTWTDEQSNTAVRPYRYAVATYDSCGNISAMSASHRTIHLQISLAQGNARNLSWTDYEGINFSTYRVYRGTEIGNMEMVMEMSAENHTYTDFDVQHDYFYQIEIVQGMKSVVISRSNIVSTNPGGITDIDGIDIAEISLFPNPATDILNITSSETISSVEIVNTLGQVVYRAEVNADNAVCDVEGLSNGVYVVRIHSRSLSGAEGAVIQQKFIKE